MKHEQMSACYFPTTVVFVEDNRTLLEVLSFTLSTQAATYKFFDNPFNAKKFLNEEYQPDLFIDRCLVRTEDENRDQQTLGINIAALQQEIYNPQRFAEVSVIVADYAMPGMTGPELAQQLQGTNFKIILLTGEADERKVIELFNQGIIHHYIRKHDQDLSEILESKILHYQKEYFQNISKIVIDNITQKPKLFNQSPSCLDDPVFIDFFKAFLNQHDFAEYYLLDDTGSYLLVSSAGELRWLIIQNEAQMAATEFDTLDDENIPHEIRQQIKDRRVLKHSFNDDDFPSSNDPADWQRFLYPATKLAGRQVYYYSYIQNPQTQPLVDKNKIMSFDQYKDQFEDDFSKSILE